MPNPASASRLLQHLTAEQPGILMIAYASIYIYQLLQEFYRYELQVLYPRPRVKESEDTFCSIIVNIYAIFQSYLILLHSQSVHERYNNNK
jgi:hypothetical protein